MELLTLTGYTKDNYILSELFSNLSLTLGDVITLQKILVFILLNVSITSAALSLGSIVQISTVL